MIEVRQAQDLTQARPLLARALKHSEGGAVDDLTRSCAVFELLDAGRVVGAFAARADDHSDGRTLTVTAAGGLPGYDLVAAMEAWAMLQTRPPFAANTLTCTTRRPGLVRKLRKRGYEIAGYVLRKKVT